jgi:PAS domain S-box-containing protein
MRGIGRSIAFKWTTFSILLATIPLTIAGVNIGQVYQKNLKESITRIQKEKASVVAERINGFIKQTTGTLLLIARDEQLRETPTAHLKAHLKNFVFQSDEVLELALLDQKGLEKFKVSIFEAEGVPDQKDQSMSQMFQVASKKQIYYGDFYYTSNGKQTMVIAVPVEKPGGRQVGILKARISLKHLTDLLHYTKTGGEGSTYVTDREGYLVAHPHEKNILMGPFIERVISGEEGSLEFETLRGARYLVVYKPIPELNWGVIVQVPAEEAYAPLREMIRTTIKWGIIAFISALALSLFLTRRLTSPVKKLSNEMTKVSKGDLDVHIKPATRDEVGLLTESFNRMIQDLKQSEQATREAEQKYRMIFENSKDMVFITSVDGKFVEINQAGVEMLSYADKEELMKTSVKDCYFNAEGREKFQIEVARKGFAKDFEIKLKKKDGTPLDCLITATARKNGNGDIIGYEGTVKDISGRKRMEEELYQRTKELETLYDLNVLINQTLDIDKVLPMALERVLNLTGFEMGTIYLVGDDGEWLELKYHQNYPSHLAEVVKRLKRGEGVVGSAIDKKEIVTFSIDRYPSSRVLPALLEERVKTLVGIPLLSKGEAVGAICLTSRSERFLGQNEVHLFESLGNQVGMVLENAKLFSSISKAKSEWETTFDTVTDLITIRDRDYRVLRANRAAYKRWGVEPDKMIGKRCYEILHHLSSPCQKCYVTETLKTGRPVSGERESQYLNGFFRYYTYPVHDESGDLIAVVDLAREITEEKRLEEEKEVVNQVNKLLASSLDVREVIKAVHAELKRILSSNRMTVTLIDEEDGKFRYFALDKDYAAEELSIGVLYPTGGTSFEKVVEKGLPMIVSYTDKSDSFLDQKLLMEGIRSSLVFPLEYQGKIIGTLNFGSQEPGRFSEKHFDVLRQIAPGMAISIQNARLLDEIKGSEEKYRTVVEGAHDGIAVIGEDFKFKFVNERLEEILGYSREELVGMDFRNVLTEESKSIVIERYIKWARKEEETPVLEFNCLRKDKEIKHMEIKNRELRDAKGNRSFVALMRDITEKKKMEEQLLQTEKLRALGEMASGVAHDFNNALAAILGNTQLLLYSAQEEETRETLKTIEKVARDSAQTVKRLQEFTRKRARQELFKLDINSIIRDVIDITRPKWKDEAQGKGIQIEMVSQLGDVGDTAGNASEMREVITNIIFNAIEAMPMGGKIELRSFREKENIYIRIADTGIGMDETTRKKIFEPFFTTKPFSNTGLGLSMSYGIIKRFGGEIKVESRVGSGTTFTLILPVTLAGAEEKIADSEIKKGKAARILVIDDEKTVRDVLAKMLSHANHRVTVATSGEEGVRLFKEQEFDMVLTDLGMPGMSGWEVCKSIKQIKSSMPVGMITGWGLEVDQGRKEEAGLDFIITKPFDFNWIVKEVSEKIEQRTAA